MLVSVQTCPIRIIRQNQSSTESESESESESEFFLKAIPYYYINTRMAYSSRHSVTRNKNLEFDVFSQFTENGYPFRNK